MAAVTEPTRAQDLARQPHAVLNLASRNRKAMKIERLLGLDGGAGRVRLLEVGTGSGGIAHWFGTHPSGRYDVDAVDVVDNRQVHDGYRYHAVRDTALPFADASFDVVLTNHVIEHVGDAEAQRAHLREVARVLAPGGVAYLAVPNRWMLVEPHYKLAFLSWLPRRWRSPYLRWRRGAPAYDCEPLSAPALERLLGDTGWRFEDLGVAAAREMRRLEPGSAGLAVFDSLPGPLKRGLSPWLPTLIYRLRRDP
jgi:SAM-dependent methyltransferase